jgi:hypothetical protein
MLENLLEYCRKSDGATKKKISGCNSAKKLVFFKIKVATLSLKITVHLIL